MLFNGMWEEAREEARVDMAGVAKEALAAKAGKGSHGMFFQVLMNKGAKLSEGKKSPGMNGNVLPGVLTIAIPELSRELPTTTLVDCKVAGHSKST